MFYCVYRYQYYRTSGQIVEGWHPAPRYAGPPGEALPAFGAGWAAKEGLAPLHDYLQRWCGQPGHTLIENGNLSLATTLWYDQPQPTTHGNCDEFEGAVVAT